MGRRLDLLVQMARGLAAQFGGSCEVVIHDLTRRDIDHSVVYVENGHVSGRKVGDGPSRVVLEALRDTAGTMEDRLAYLTKTEDGRILKSSTIFVRGDQGKVEYIFSLNYDITAFRNVEQAIRSIVVTEPEQERQPGREGAPQQITHNVSELLDLLIEQALALVGKPVAVMNKEDKVRVVQYLNDAGAFLITKSGDRVAGLLDISKFTLYHYMDEGKKEDKKEDKKTQDRGNPGTS